MCEGSREVIERRDTQRLLVHASCERRNALSIRGLAWHHDVMGTGFGRLRTASDGAMRVAEGCLDSESQQGVFEAVAERPRQHPNLQATKSNGD